MEEIGFIGFKVSLRQEHLYAVGLKIEGGSFCPLQTCETQKELSEAYDKWYKFAKSSESTLPIAIEKIERNADWRDAKCHTLPKLMQEIIDKNRKDRN